MTYARQKHSKVKLYTDVRLPGKRTSSIKDSVEEQAIEPGTTVAIQECLQLAIDGLSPKERLVLRLYLQRKSYRKIAKDLGLSKDQVMRAFHRCLDKIREKIGGLEFPNVTNDDLARNFPAVHELNFCDKCTAPSLFSVSPS